MVQKQCGIDTMVQKKKENNNMKRFLILLMVLQISTVVLAQSGYRVEIVQVFPRRAVVYSNVFNIKRELDNAVSSQSAKLRGNNCNYKINIKTPSGSETRYIQNIVWVESVNGAKSYHKKQTSPAHSYKSATNWQGYSCNLDGSPKGTIKKNDFIYRVSLIGGTKDYETEFVDLSHAKSEAKKVFSKFNEPERLVEVVIFRFSGSEKTIIEKLTNMEEFLEYKNTQAIADSLENEKRKVQMSIKTHSDEFIKRLTYIDAQKDSLGDEGIRMCVVALKESLNDIPDSVFTVEKLDSIFCSVLFECLLLSNNKKIHELKTEIQQEINKGTTGTRTILLGYAQQIEAILSSPMQHEEDQKFAYEKVIPAGTQPYKFVVDGVEYSFYEFSPQQDMPLPRGVLVNEETKEYEIGTFVIVYRAKKVKRYTRDGNKKH